ncbi:MAG: hypothetical protein JNK89_00955 [Saprospiraceae bacterium]|nr:hypothetical protein [Saprospiraceae bacterium]
MLKAPALIFGTLLLGLSACTTVYFENPVPRQGTEMTEIPAAWAGLYLAAPSADETATLTEQLLRQGFRLERPAPTQLLVSTDYRIHERDLPLLRAELEKQMQEGAIANFQLTESMLLCTVRSDGREEQQYTALVKQGAWYVLAQTAAPFQFFDLSSKQQVEYELERNTRLEAGLLPEADSLRAQTAPLVARQSGKGWYFNKKDAETGWWTLLYVEPAARGELRVQMSNLSNPEAFKTRVDDFNRMTPFRKIDSDHYLIQPDDAALVRLLATEGLFQTTRLLRIEE